MLPAVLLQVPSLECNSQTYWKWLQTLFYVDNNQVKDRPNITEEQLQTVKQQVASFYPSCPVSFWNPDTNDFNLPELEQFIMRMSVPWTQRVRRETTSNNDPCYLDDLEIALAYLSTTKEVLEFTNEYVQHRCTEADYPIVKKIRNARLQELRPSCNIETYWKWLQTLFYVDENNEVRDYSNITTEQVETVQQQISELYPYCPMSFWNPNTNNFNLPELKQFVLRMSQPYSRRVEHLTIEKPNLPCNLRAYADALSNLDTKKKVLAFSDEYLNRHNCEGQYKDIQKIHKYRMKLFS